MQFTLHYRGPLRSNGRPQHKHDLRRHFHKQLRHLWGQEPLRQFAGTLLGQANQLGIARPAVEAGRAPSPPPRDNSLSVLRPLGPYTFAPLVSTTAALVAELEVTLLWPHEFGHIVTQGGDIDNRIKTLLDALRVPQSVQELPPGATPSEHEIPFYCLLEDDSLITKLAIDSAQLLELPVDESEVAMNVRVTTKQVRVMVGTIGLA
jgi:hypothetical protein